MEVKAASGLKCPMEGTPRKYIDDATAVAVADSAYYRRLVEDGSLVNMTADMSASTNSRGGTN